MIVELTLFCTLTCSCNCCRVHIFKTAMLSLKNVDIFIIVSNVTFIQNKCLKINKYNVSVWEMPISSIVDKGSALLKIMSCGNVWVMIGSIKSHTDILQVIWAGPTNIPKALFTNCLYHFVHDHMTTKCLNVGEIKTFVYKIFLTLIFLIFNKTRPLWVSLLKSCSYLCIMRDKRRSSESIGVSSLSFIKCWQIILHIEIDCQQLIWHYSTWIDYLSSLSCRESAALSVKMNIRWSASLATALHSQSNKLLRRLPGILNMTNKITLFPELSSYQFGLHLSNKSLFLTSIWCPHLTQTLSWLLMVLFDCLWNEVAQSAELAGGASLDPAEISSC